MNSLKVYVGFFFSTDVDSFNICQPSFAKVAMWIIMADFLNENIHIIFALFYFFIFFFFGFVARLY